MQLSDVRYQDVAQSQLQRALHSGRMPHAYLFAGPPGVGKEMLATRLAQVLLCPNAAVTGRVAVRDAAASNAPSAPAEAEAPTGLFGPLSEASGEDVGGLFGAMDAPPSVDSGEAVAPVDVESATSNRAAPPPEKDCSIEACGQCVDCTLLTAGTHPDFHRIHRMLSKLHPNKEVRNRKATVLSIDVIRQFLLAPIGLRPSRGRAKVFVIVEAERLNQSAENAMLKTLEEPPGDSYLILLANSADSLLATTRSRCQQVVFGPLPTDFIVEHLTAESKIDRNAALFFAELAQGSLGHAQRYVELGIGERVEALCETIRQAESEPLAASKRLQDIAKDLAGPLKKYQDEDEGDTNASRDAQLLVLAMIATLLRDTQRMAAGAKPILSEARVKQGKGPLPVTRHLRHVFRAINEAEYQISSNANTGLIFDSIGIALNRAGHLAV